MTPSRRGSAVQRVDPPYLQIADHYTRRIRSGQLKPGDFLPTIAQLMEENGVSRATASRAVDKLKTRGLVETIPAKGIRVLGHPEPQQQTEPQQQQELHEDLAALPPKRRSNPGPRPGTRRP